LQVGWSEELDAGSRVDIAGAAGELQRWLGQDERSFHAASCS
jgi:hypothetical protein